MPHSPTLDPSETLDPRGHAGHASLTTEGITMLGCLFVTALIVFGVLLIGSD